MFTLLTRMAKRALNLLLSTISKGRNLENEMEINNRRKMKTLWIDLVLVKAASMVCWCDPSWPACCSSTWTAFPPLPPLEGQAKPLNGHSFKVVSHAMCAKHPAHLDEGLPFNNTFLTQNAQNVRDVILQLDILEVSPDLWFRTAWKGTLRRHFHNWGLGCKARKRKRTQLLSLSWNKSQHLQIKTKQDEH